MTMYTVILTKEQLLVVKEQVAKVNITTGEDIIKALEAAQPFFPKIWRPFTSLKDGGTYRSIDGREFTVEDTGVESVYCFHSKGDDADKCWAYSGAYDLTHGRHDLDLILELQEETACTSS